MKTKEVQQRERLISDVINIAQTIYPNDRKMLSEVIDLTITLQVAEYNKVSIDFVDGMIGFMLWGSNRTDIDSGLIFTTLMHDLNEFAVSGSQNWFSPRTAGYTKYLSGASNVIVSY